MEEKREGERAKAEGAAKSEEEKLEEMVRKAKEYINAISYYPHITSYEEKERARKALLKLYKKAPMKVKSNIIFGINEKLSSARELKAFIRVGDIKASSAKELGQKLGMKVLNYENSLDGILEFLSLLEEMGDGLALKLLTYHTSRYLALPPSYASRVLISNALQLLGKSNHPYAAHFLLRTALPEQSEVGNAYLMALSMWKDKVGKVKLKKAERERIRKLLSSMLEEGDVSYTR